MIERLESKIEEIVNAILEKPASEFTKSDFDILAGEYYRIKTKKDSDEQAKKMTEMLANLWTH